VLVCLAVSGFFGANVLASARPVGAAVTVPITVPTVPTVSTTVPTVTTPTVTTPTVTTPTVTTPTVTTPTVTTPTVTTPTVTTPQTTTVPTTAPTVPVSVPAVPQTVPTATVSVTTPVATVSVTTPSSSSVVTSAAREGSAAVTGQSGTRAGTTSVASQGSAAGVGSPAASAADGFSTGSGSTVSGGAAALIPVVASRAGRPAVFLGRLRLERLPGPRPTVGLRLVLSRPARVRFLVIGPAPSCQVAGRFVLAGHQGPNKVAFRGRVRGRLLRPGIYTIVPQPAAGSRRPPKTVAVAIDARGVRPTAPVRWRNCDPAAAAASPVLLFTLLTGGKALPALALRASGVAATEAIAPAKRLTAAERRPAVFGWFPNVRKSPQLSAFLLGLLVVSIALLSLAAVEPGHMVRFRTVRVIAYHRGQIAGLGGALLITALLLLLL
jgi:hypothetical protein